MLNPLDIISVWFEELPAEIQEELVSLSSHFHPDQGLENHFSLTKRTRLFQGYLNSEGLSKKEVVLRTLSITRLIEFSLEDRDTENKWNDMMNSHLELRSKAKSTGRSTEVHDNFLNNFHDSKEVWLTICLEWKKLRAGDLTDRKIGNWYFLNS